MEVEEVVLATDTASCALRAVSVVIVTANLKAEELKAAVERWNCAVNAVRV